MVLSAVSAAPQFARDQRVICKPDAFGYRAGVGKVKDELFGNVIVYFEGTGATVFMPDDLEVVTVAAPGKRLPLSTPVRLRSGETGVISAYNPNDSQRYQVSYLDRHFWQVRHKFYDRGCFEVIGVAASATGAALTA